MLPLFLFTFVDALTTQHQQKLPFKIEKIMRLGICTIQRDRGRWLEEWIILHYLVGFRKFYIFLHNCNDNSYEIALELQKKYDIKAFVVGNDVDRPQLVSYQYAYSNFSHEVDWMAFIDGDEFLFPPSASSIQDVLEDYTYEKLSALAVYWACFGSSGHLKEPDGLILQNFRYRLSLNHPENRHVKSIVRGHHGESITICPNAHLFNTPNGTFDELSRPITWGLTPYEPSHISLRINHYCTQSWEFFKNWKQTSGSADAGRHSIRPDSKFIELDSEHILDDTIQRFMPKILELL
jgi:hypothetical protein